MYRTELSNVFKYQNMVVVDWWDRGTAITNRVQALAIDMSGSMSGRNTRIVQNCTRVISNMPTPTYVGTWSSRFKGTVTKLNTNNIADAISGEYEQTNRDAAYDCMTALMNTVIKEHHNNDDTLLLTIMLIGDGQFNDRGKSSQSIRKDVENHWLKLASIQPTFPKPILNFQVVFMCTKHHNRIPKEFEDVLGNDDANDQNRVLRVYNTASLRDALTKLSWGWKVASLVFATPVRRSGSSLGESEVHQLIGQEDQRFTVFICSDVSCIGISLKGYPVSYMRTFERLPHWAQRSVIHRYTARFNAIDFEECVTKDDLDAAFIRELDMFHEYTDMPVEQTRVWQRILAAMYSVRGRTLSHATVSTMSTITTLEKELAALEGIESEISANTVRSIVAGTSSYKKRNTRRTVRTVAEIKSELSTIRHQMIAGPVYTKPSEMLNIFERTCQDNWTNAVETPPVSNMHHAAYQNRRRTIDTGTVAYSNFETLETGPECDICTSRPAFILTCPYMDTESKTTKYHNRVCFRCMGLSRCPICRNEVDMNIVFFQRVSGTDVLGPFRLHFDNGIGKCLKAIECIGSTPVISTYNCMESILSPLRIGDVDNGPDIPAKYLVPDGGLLATVFGDTSNNTEPRRALIKKLLRVVGTVPVIVLTRGYAKWCLKVLSDLLGPTYIRGFTAIVDTHGCAYLRETDFSTLRRVNSDLFTTFGDNDLEIEKNVFCVSLGISPVLYVDDDLERFDATDGRSKQATIIEIALPLEGTGIENQHVDDIVFNISTKGVNCIVIDFDCTLSVRHMSKLLLNEQGE
jgi:hypothetical protein